MRSAYSQGSCLLCILAVHLMMVCYAPKPHPGDEVDPGNIISGGRRARRGRAGGEARPKYSAKAQLDSDEDEW